MRETRGKYVLLLNPDCVALQDVASPLIACLEAHPEAGACGAVIRDADGTIQRSARRFPGITTGFAGRASWLTRAWPDNPFTAHNLVLDEPQEPMVVDWVSGACMMVRRDAFEQVGGMDEQFFLYWEDADLCRRLRREGWLTLYCPPASVAHVTGQSSERAPSNSLVAFHRSAYRYYHKHGGRLARLFAPCVFLALQLRLWMMLWRLGNTTRGTDAG
jgi:GT2 family glycosyltransferase